MNQGDGKLRYKDFAIPKAVLLLLVVTTAFSAQAARPGWKSEKVNWRMTGGRQIKAVNYPEEKPLPTLAEKGSRKTTVMRRRILPDEAAPEPETLEQKTADTVITAIINSPPIDGFVPWVAVAVTDARSYGFYDSYAYPETSVTGNYLTGNPQADYAIGIFDTGASTSLISYTDSVQTGIDAADLVTSTVITLQGAIGGTIDAWASHSLAIFVDELAAIDPCTLLLDDSGMLGESNISIIVGDTIESPNLPTVLGSPFAYHCAADFHNDRQTTRIFDGNELTAPVIRFYDKSDPCIPDYPNKITLQLRPSDSSSSIWYFPCVEIPDIWECPDGDGSPQTPTMIADGSFQYQGLFFFPGVYMENDGEIAPPLNKFIFDTGAQVSVISETVAAFLRINPALPDFEVDIIDVTGANTTKPGFFIDSLEIPALGYWLKLTNVPVIMLNVDSPEGDTLDGIIGMNLFTELNFVFCGGGLSGDDPAYIKFTPIINCALADIAPAPNGDGVVDTNDLALFADAWLATANPPAPNWDPNCNLAPYLLPDEIINFLDFSIFADCWRLNTKP